MLHHSLIHFFDRHRMILGEVLQQTGKAAEWTLALKDKLPTVIESKHDSISLLQPQTISDRFGNGYPALGSQGTDGHHILLFTASPGSRTAPPASASRTSRR